MLKHVVIVAIGGVLATVLTMTYAQDAKNAHDEEVTAQVPALQKFHAPIYKLWHTAWQKKDTAMMASLCPEIEKGVADIAAVQLSGILQEKQGAWQENLKQLQDITSMYKTAVAGTGLQAKLDAAEKLHGQYEKMVRMIQPVMKELDAFHQVLYMIYHHYMPEHKTDELKNAVTELSEKMDTLNAAKLPERLMKKEASFQAARAKLSASVSYSKGVMASKDEKKINDAIRRVHSDFEAVEKAVE